MKYGSVCSGVEAATVAWHHLGWEPQWFSEIEKFPSAVLNYHYPNVPNLGDMTNYKEWSNEPINLLVGGTPCQSFSVAGLRKGLDDPRGNLMLTYLGIADRYKPKWLVWENVPGVLSSNKGRDFGTFLGALGALGYGFSYRVLDAQYFGVAQRRRRVFVVGYLGDWRRAAAVLFERESLSGHTAPSRETGKEVAKCLTSRVGQAMCCQTEQFVTEDLKWPAEVASTLNASFGSKQGLEDQHINGGAPLFIPGIQSVKTVTASYGTGGADYETKPLVYGIPGNWIGRKPENGGNSTTPMDNIAPNLTSTDKHGVAFTQNTRAIAGTLTRASSAGGTVTQQDINAGHIIHANMSVRRLSPRECERLQGFPDDYTQIPYRNKDAKDCPDGPRYKAMGNSMAVPVMRWIGERIQMVEEIKIE